VRSYRRRIAYIQPRYRFRETDDIKEVYLNMGEEISASSVAAVYKNRMLVGAVFDPKFLDCKW
jgi:hypothetical protein